MKKLIVFISCLFFAACGGGGGSNSNPAAVSPVAKGVFVDGPVAGLGYTSGNKVGKTGSNGEFEYTQGEKVKFFIGDIILGETTGAPIVTLLHLVPGENVDNVRVINISRFLLSVGKLDPETNTIKIPDSVTIAAKGKNINFNISDDSNLLEIVKFLTNDINAVLVSPEVASKEISTNILKLYGGTYEGIFTGPAASTKWSLKIDPDTGIVSGGGIDGTKELIEGSIIKGVIFNGKAQGGCTITGVLNIFTGQLSGSWYFNYDPSRNGTFTGKKVL